MDWSKDASDEARSILRAHGDDLYEEAERIAKRAEASAVSKQYVATAASMIKLRRKSGAADAMLATGPAMVTLAAGVGVADLTAKMPLNLSSTVVGITIAVGALGLLLTGAGTALKFRS